MKTDQRDRHRQAGGAEKQDAAGLDRRRPTYNSQAKSTGQAANWPGTDTPLDQIRDQIAADEARFRLAYQLGFEAGREVGRLQLDHELTEQDRRRTEYIHGLATSPSYAQLEARRWDGRREDFGKPRPGDFLGVASREAAA